MKQHPQLRKTCEMTTVIEKLPDDLNISEKEYKVISKPQNSSKVLMQEKILSTQLRTKIKKYENDISQLENYMSKLVQRQEKLENENFELKNVIGRIKKKMSNEEIYDYKASLGETQEDIDDKIVRLQVKMRKIDFETKIKLKEAAEKRKILLAKEIKYGVVDSSYQFLKSYAKEFKWILSLNKFGYFLQEFKKIIDLINDDHPDDSVTAFIKELKSQFDKKSEVSKIKESLEENLNQKELDLSEIEQRLKELHYVSKLKSDVYDHILAKK